MQYKNLARTVPLLLCGVMSSISWAQTGPSVSKGNPVASPNRTLFSSLAKTSKGTVSTSSNTSGVLIVDSGGKTIGRWMTLPNSSSSAVLMTYNNQPMQALGLGYDYWTQSYGLNWYPTASPNVPDFTISYESADCSGPAFIQAFAYPGTRYTAMPMTDVWPPVSGSIYLLVADAMSTHAVTIKSRFYLNQCYTLTTPYETGTYQIVGSIPASAIGTPPYFIK